MFEFLTPFNAQDFQEEDKFDHNLDYPDYFQLIWTGKPYVQIEWISYAPSAMLPAYRLQGFQYKLTKSNEFSLPITGSLATRTVVPVRLSLQCLSVPNKIYIWAEGSETSMRDSFLWGGMFRTCEIVNNSLMVRVNGESHIIDRPDNQSMLFKWWKRNSNSVQEYPTWQKNMVIILTPNEIGLNNWLENDAQLSTLEISCDVRLSRLQQIEYEPAETEHFLQQSGISGTVHNANTLDYFEYEGLHLGAYAGTLWGDTNTGVLNRLKFDIHLRMLDHSRGYLTSWIPQTTPAMFDEVKDKYLSYSADPEVTHARKEKVNITNINRTLVQLYSTIWIKYRPSINQFVGGFWYVPKTYLFEFSEYNNDEKDGFKFVP